MVFSTTCYYSKGDSARRFEFDLTIATRRCKMNRCKHGCAWECGMSKNKGINVIFGKDSELLRISEFSPKSFGGNNE